MIIAFQHHVIHNGILCLVHELFEKYVKIYYRFKSEYLELFVLIIWSQTDETKFVKTESTECDLALPSPSYFSVLPQKEFMKGCVILL